MKKTTLLIISIFITLCTHAQNYQQQLEDLNSFLKNLSGGYYGYIEVKDGYIYQRFKAGKYNRFKMEDIEGAFADEYKQKVILKCKDNNSCIETDWEPNGKRSSTPITSSANFDHNKLASLINDFRDAYLGITTISQKVQTALNNLNAHLTNFDRDRYRGMEIKNGYLYNNYPDGKYSRAKLSDIDKAYYYKEKRQIKLACKNDSACIYSSITNLHHEFFNFTTSVVGSDFQKLNDLLNTLIDAYNNRTTTQGTVSNISSSDKKQDALSILNDYLKEFNRYVYKDIKVADNKVYFYFTNLNKDYYVTISVKDLKENTELVEATRGKKLIISSKNNSYRFFSGYSNENINEFQYSTVNVNIPNTNKLKLLLQNFIQSL